MNSLSAATFYLGSYTSKGQSQGILVGQIDESTGKLGPIKLAAAAKDPSFTALSPDGKFLYAALESDSAVAAFAVQADGSLTPLNQQPSGGGGACHVWVAGGHVFVANYGGGNIAVFPIKPDGSLGDRTAFVTFTGQGPNASRQTKPHAHGMITDSAAKFAYACDLGTDKVWSFAFDATRGTLTPTEPEAGIVPPGGGPRHLALSADGRFLYVNTEMGHTIAVFARDPEKGTLALVQTIPTLPEGAATEGVLTAEIMTHPSGKWLYVSNRTHDSLTVYAIGADGRLTWVENVPSQVQIPRGFGIDPSGKWLLVGGQADGKLALLKIDPATGRLTDTGERAEAGAPVSVTFAP